MTEVRAVVQDLFSNKSPSKPVKDKKDPLAETKKMERFQKEVHKAERQLQKERKQDDIHLVAEAARLERQWKLEDSELSHLPVSKRAQKEQREAQRKEEFKATGQYCEHGVYRCRICEHDKYHHNK